MRMKSFFLLWVHVSSRQMRMKIRAKQSDFFADMHENLFSRLQIFFACLTIGKYILLRETNGIKGKAIELPLN